MTIFAGVLKLKRGCEIYFKYKTRRETCAKQKAISPNSSLYSYHNSFAQQNSTESRFLSLYKSQRTNMQWAQRTMWERY